MFSGRHLPLIGIGLALLFLFKLIPADVFHEHSSAVDHHDRSAGLINVECSICDLVLPVQLDVEVAVIRIIDRLIGISVIPGIAAELEGTKIISFGRDPPVQF